VQYRYDKTTYKKRHLVENLFAKIKDWRRIHTSYDRCARTFMSAICIAATVIFWLNQ
jgi:transposase